MGQTVISGGNLLPIILDMAARRTIESIASVTPRVGTFTFARGDTLKGRIQMVTPSGSPSPLYYLVLMPTYEIALTNGENMVYATATGWEALGGTTNPHQTFNLDVMGTALDAALHQTTGLFIPAWLEIHVSGFPVGEGSTFAQDQFIVREWAEIYKSALNPVP